MMDERRRIELWTLRQRKALLGLSIVLLIFLSIEAWRKSAWVSDPPPDTTPRADEIQDRIDPNTADAAELSGIPNLGESRARDIVAYRETFARQHPGVPPFKSANDLMRVKGIGPGISSNMEPYLFFTGK